MPHPTYWNPHLDFLFLVISQIVTSPLHSFFFLSCTNLKWGTTLFLLNLQSTHHTKAVAYCFTKGWGFQRKLYHSIANNSKLELLGWSLPHCLPQHLSPSPNGFCLCISSHPPPHFSVFSHLYWVESFWSPLSHHFFKASFLGQGRGFIFHTKQAIWIVF